MKKLPLQGRTLALLAVIIPLLVLFIYGRSAIRAARPGRCDGGKRGITGYHTGAVRHRHGGGALHLQDRTDVCRARQTAEVHVGDQVKAGQVLGRDGAGRP